MGFGTFRNDPKSYLKSHHEVRIAQNQHAFNALIAAVPAAIPGGGTAREYIHNGAAPFTDVIPFMNVAAVNQKNAGMKLHKVIGRRLGFSPKFSRLFNSGRSGVDIGVRWLPYEVGYVTYMQIDTAATFALTGELSGCTVATGEAGGSIYYFHSFAPNGFHGPNARNIQRNMIDHVANQLGLANMEYAENTIDYDGFAFGFGKLKNRTWKFYIYGSNSGVSKMAQY